MTNYDAYGERSIPRMMQMTEHGAKFLVELPSLRDQFAMAALPALIATANLPHIANAGLLGSNSEVAEACYTIADAMMQQRAVGK